MEKLLKELIEKVNILIKIQVLTGFQGLNQSDKIMALYGIGVAQKDIADILGVPLNSVTGVVSSKRPKRKISGK